VSENSNNSMNYELDWSMQRTAHDRGRLFIASVGRVYYGQRKGIAHRGRSLIFMIALLLEFYAVFQNKIHFSRILPFKKVFFALIV